MTTTLAELREAAERVSTESWAASATDIEEAEEHVGWAVLTRTHEHNGDDDQEEAARDAAVADAAFVRLASPSAILALIDRCERAEANYRFMVERAADEKLDGYRELADRLRVAVERAERAEAARDLSRQVVEIAGTERDEARDVLRILDTGPCRFCSSNETGDPHAEDCRLQRALTPTPTGGDDE